MAVKVSPKFQAVLPEAVRSALGIVAGSRMEVIAKGKVAYLSGFLAQVRFLKQLYSSGRLDICPLRVATTVR